MAAAHLFAFSSLDTDLGILYTPFAMNSAKYAQILTEARQDLEALLDKRAQLDKSIARLKATIAALSPLADDKSALNFLREIADKTGITEGCREVLKTAEGPLTAVEVREQLLRLGYDLKKYSNAMASIHSVLKRLVEGEEAHTIVSLMPGKPTRYKWGKRQTTHETLGSLARGEAGKK